MEREEERRACARHRARAHSARARNTTHGREASEHDGVLRHGLHAECPCAPLVQVAAQPVSRSRTVSPSPRRPSASRAGRGQAREPRWLAARAAGSPRRHGSGPARRCGAGRGAGPCAGAGDLDGGAGRRSHLGAPTIRKALESTHACSQCEGGCAGRPVRQDACRWVPVSTRASRFVSLDACVSVCVCGCVCVCACVWAVLEVGSRWMMNCWELWELGGD